MGIISCWETSVQIGKFNFRDFWCSNSIFWLFSEGGKYFIWIKTGVQTGQLYFMGVGYDHFRGVAYDCFRGTLLQGHFMNGAKTGHFFSLMGLGVMIFFEMEGRGYQEHFLSLWDQSISNSFICQEYLYWVWGHISLILRVKNISWDH